MDEGDATERRAIIHIAPEMLAQLLQLPPGAEIIGAEMRFDYRGVVRLHLRGFGIATRPGEQVNIATGLVTTFSDGRQQKIDWTFG